MRPLLGISMVLIPIFATSYALIYIRTKDRQFRRAELRLIGTLGSDFDRYRNSIALMVVANRFLADESPDLSQLASVITTVAETAQGLEGTQDILRILRSGSDKNRARYLVKLLKRVEPPPPRPRDRGSPSPNDPSPSAGSLALEPVWEPVSRRRSL